MPSKKEKEKEKDKATRTYVNADKINERHKRRVNLMSHSDSERGRRAKDVKSHDSYGAVVSLESGKGKKVKVRNSKAKTHSNRGGTMRKGRNTDWWDELNDAFDPRVGKWPWEQFVKEYERYANNPSMRNALRLERIGDLAADLILESGKNPKDLMSEKQIPLTTPENTRLGNNLDFSDMVPDLARSLFESGLNAGKSGMKNIRDQWNRLSPQEKTTKRLAKRAIPASSTKHSNKYFK